MNWKSWVPLVLAIVLGIVAAKVARDALTRHRTVAGPQEKFTRIVVARGNIAPGQELTAGDLTLAQVQADLVPENTFQDLTAVVGRVTETQLVKGQSIVEQMLAIRGSGSGLQALIPPGMRAISVEVNEFSGVAGLITPGCRVDLLATISEGSDSGQVARTIVQNVKVTAVGQRTGAGDSAQAPPDDLSRSVTVLVSPTEAEAIELACSTGRPRLVLRGGRDQKIADTPGISLSELRGSTVQSDPVVPPQAIVVAPPPPPVVETPTPVVVDRPPPRRVIKMIKGGVESSVVLSLPDHPATEAYGTTDSSDPFEAN